MIEDKKCISYVRDQKRRYPTYKIESGLECKGIISTLNKPHGLKELMGQIIQEVQKSPKRFEPLVKKLSFSYTTEDVLDAIEIMVMDGVIQTKSKNKRPNKSDLEWELQLLNLDPRARDQDNETSKKDLLKEDYENFKERFNEIVKEAETSLLRDHIYKCVDEKVLLTSNGEKICSYDARIKFQSVILSLAYALILLKQGRQENLRVVSERIWGKSKILDRYKKDIILVSGKPLSQLNLTNPPEVIFVYGDIVFDYKGSRSSFLAGFPYCLTEATVKDIDIKKASIEKIFIIENLAAFQEVFFRVYNKKPNVLLFWSAGYISTPKLHLLKIILQIHPVPVYIWSDLDSDGLGLTLDIIKKIRRYTISAYPVLMGAAELDLAKGQYRAANHYNLNDPELYTFFPDVIERIKKQNVMEQEELLLHFDMWKEKLP
jgi:hypothetical protein